MLFLYQGFGWKGPKILPQTGMMENEVVEENDALYCLFLEVCCDVGKSANLLFQVSSASLLSFAGYNLSAF